MSDSNSKAKPTEWPWFVTKDSLHRFSDDQCPDHCDEVYTAAAYLSLSTRVRELEAILIECQAAFECDLMAVGHDKDGPARTQAMAGLRDIIARIAALLPQAPNKPEPK